MSIHESTQIGDADQRITRSPENESAFTWKDKVAPTLPKPFRSYPLDIQKAALATDRQNLPFEERRRVFNNYVFFILRNGQPLSLIAEDLGTPEADIKADRDHFLDDDSERLVPFIRSVNVLATQIPTFADLPKAIVQKLKPYLKPGDMEIMQGITTNTSIEEIAKRLETSTRTVSRRTQEIVRLASTLVIAPHGFVKLADHNIQYNGHQPNPVESVLFLRARYSRPEFIQKYKDTTQRAIDPEIVEKGLLPLTDVTTDEERRTLLITRRELLTQHGVRFYITPEHLAFFRKYPRSRLEMYKKGFVLLYEIVDSKQEYARIHNSRKDLCIPQEDGVYINIDEYNNYKNEKNKTVEEIKKLLDDGYIFVMDYYAHIGAPATSRERKKLNEGARRNMFPTKRVGINWYAKPEHIQAYLITGKRILE